MFTVLCLHKIEGESNQFISWCVIKWFLVINRYVIFTCNSKKNSKSVLFAKNQIFLFYIYFIFFFFFRIPFSQNVIDPTIKILFWSQIVCVWILALPITRCVILCKICAKHFTPPCLTFLWKKGNNSTHLVDVLWKRSKFTYLKYADYSSGHTKT